MGLKEDFMNNFTIRSFEFVPGYNGDPAQMALTLEDKNGNGKLPEYFNKLSKEIVSCMHTTVTSEREKYEIKF